MQIYLKNYDCLAVEEKHLYEHEAGYRLLAYMIQLCDRNDCLGEHCTGAKQPVFQESLFDSISENIVKTSLGKPYFKTYPSLKFNISHTSGLVACVLSSLEVGIDAERIRPFPRAVLRKMTQKEQAYILNAQDSDEAFMRVWTMKEAYIKMTGEGLSAFQKIECIPGQEMDGVSYRQFLWQNQYVVTAVEMSAHEMK